jgi:hypothetical protein
MIRRPGDQEGHPHLNADQLRNAYVDPILHLTSCRKQLRDTYVDPIPHTLLDGKRYVVATRFSTDVYLLCVR